MYCNDDHKGIGGEIVCRKTAADPDKEYGVHIELMEVSSSGSHNAVLTVEFFRDWGKSSITETLSPGEYKSYTDPDGVEWQVHVYSTIYNGIWSTAELGVCYDDATTPPPDDETDDEPDPGEPGDEYDDIPTDEEYPPKSQVATDLSSLFGDIKPIYIAIAIIIMLLLG